VSLTPPEAARHGLALNQDGQRRTAFDLLSYPNVSVSDVARIWPQLANLPRTISEQLETDAKYDVYLSRQAADVDAYRRDESFALADDLDYASLPGLSNEAKQKLSAHRPRTIGQAARLDGMTPAALTLIVAHVKRGRGKVAKSA
jgi:tRNA uridine 5-carboxymethylaminomethyl modification enzyme